MDRLTIKLFGPFQVAVNDSLIVNFSTEKERALFTYLVLEQGFPHRRESLSSLFWPERSETLARQNLRQALYKIRRAIDDHCQLTARIQVINDEVRYNPQVGDQVDVYTFTSLLNVCKEHHQGVRLCTECVSRLQIALGLYRGEFLAGFSLSDSSQFEWWSFNKKETFHRQALNALSLLGKYYLQQGNFTQAADIAQKKIVLEPWRESAYRLLMLSLALQGQRGEALRQYETCNKILNKELGVNPSEETIRLYQRIRNELPLHNELLEEN